MRLFEERVSALEARVAKLEQAMGLNPEPEAPRVEAAPMAPPPRQAEQASHLPPPTIGYADRGPSPRQSWLQAYRSKNQTPEEREARRRADQERLKASIMQEKYIGQRILPFAGAVLCILGIFFGISYLDQKGWITPGLTFAAEVAASLLVVALGLFLQTKKKDYGLVIQGVGGAGLFASLLAGAYFQKVYPEALCWPLCLGLAGVLAGWGAWNQSRSLLWVGILGGLIASFLAPPAVTFWIVLAVSASASVAMVWRKWIADTTALALVLVGAFYVLWLAANEFPFDHRSIAAILSFLMAWGAYMATWKDGRDEFDPGALFPAFCGPVFLVLAWPRGMDASLALVAVGALMAAPWLLKWKGAAPRVSAGVGAVLAFLLAPWGLPEAEPTQAMWAVKGGVFLLVALGASIAMAKTRHGGWAWLGAPSLASFAAFALVSLAPWESSGPAVLPRIMLLLAALAAGGHLWTSFEAKHGEWVQPLGNQLFVLLTAGALFGAPWPIPSAFAGAAAASLISLMVSRMKDQPFLGWSSLTSLLTVMSLMLIPDMMAQPVEMTILTVILAACLGSLGLWPRRLAIDLQAGLSLVGLFAVIRLSFLLLPSTNGFPLTLALASYALALLGMGIWQKLSGVRWVAYALLGLGAVKAILLDVMALPDGQRAIAFLSIGAAFLVGGGLVVFLWKRISPPPASTDGGDSA